MDRKLLGICLGIAVSVTMGSVVFAQDLKEIVVTAKHVVATKSGGKSRSGMPILDMSISYGVSYSELDLKSVAGAAELEKRVNDTAKEACREIANQRPDLEFMDSDAQCAKDAAGPALMKARALIAEAAKGHTR